MISNTQTPIIQNKLTLTLIGVLNILLFLAAISGLYFFLFSEPRWKSDLGITSRVLVDIILLSLMSVPHSLILESRWKMKILKWVPSEMFFTIYSLHASLSLLAIFIFWQPFGEEIYHLNGQFRFVVIALNVLSWLFMAYALFSTGALKHNGVEQWWNELKGRKTKYHVPYEHAYRYMRHPIFFAFFLMIWVVPQMTWGRLLVAVFWTVYLIIGTLRKESNLMRNHTYKKYISEVGAYPFFPKRSFRNTFKWGKL